MYSRRTPINRFTSVAAGAAVCLAAGGCLIVTGNTRHETGVRISDSTISQVEPGKTTEAWLLATLGEPTARTRIDCRVGSAIADANVTGPRPSPGFEHVRTIARALAW